MLRAYAVKRWHAIVDSMGKGSPLPPNDHSALAEVVAALGSQATEVIGIVDRFVLGAAAEAVGAGATTRGPGAEFGSQLERVLAGFTQIANAPVQENSNVGIKGQRPKVFQSDLWQVLHKIRESAELSYAREVDLVELDRRIVFLLRVRGPLVPAGLSTAIGVDKAQVSRSVKRLLELKLVQREQIRSPVTLSRKGEALADKLLRLAELRNRELTFDVSDKELAQFFAVMETLLDRAIQLYDQERDIAQRIGQASGDPEPAPGLEPRKAGEAIQIDRSRIVSPMLTLSSYYARSGALAFKRKTGLSNFEAWVLSEISYNPPTEWSRLVNALQRDHSQAGRTVNHLIERGLVVREGRPGRRHGRFNPTKDGERLYDIIVETGDQRSEFLMAPLDDETLKTFMSTFDKIRRNAAAQLERERAYEELESN